MRIITNYYKKLAIIECTCCRENHTITLTMDYDDKTLWFESNERYTFWERFKNWIKIKKNRTSFIYGNNRNYYELLLGRNQLEQIRDLLKEEGYIVQETCIIPTNIDEYTLSYFDVNGVIFGKEKEEGTYIISLHLRDEDEDWSFTSGCSCNCLDEREVGHFLYIINTLLGE